MTIEKIATVIVEYLATLPNGTAISTSDAVERIYGLEYLPGDKYRIEDTEIGFVQFFDLNDAVLENAKQVRLVLDTSGNEGIPTGLPFHIPYIISRVDSNRY